MFGKLFIVNSKQICVQSLPTRLLSGCNFISAAVPTSVNRSQDYFLSSRVNGHNKLNVQFSRPFHSHIYCSSNLRSYQSNLCGLHKRFAGSLGVHTDSKENIISEFTDKGKVGDLTKSSLSQLSAAVSEDDSDEEEFRKQEIWNMGPTPAPTFNFAAYANDSDIIQKFVQLGVNLSKLELKYGMMPFILKLDFEKDVAPYIRYLCDNGVDPNILGWYLTKNPHILKEDLQNLDKRLDYMRLKKFSREDIIRIINVNPYWLSFSVTRIDRKLGFFQTFFKLRGNQVRQLAASGPMLITSNLEHVKDITFTVKEEMGFSSEEIVHILLKKPRIFWKEKRECIWKSFDYLHNTVKFTHEEFVRCPELLLVRDKRLKQRIGFLQHVGKAQFNPNEPNYVTYKMIFSGDDSEFATKVAKSSVLEYNEYMKCL